MESNEIYHYTNEESKIARRRKKYIQMKSMKYQKEEKNIMKNAKQRKYN